MTITLPSLPAGWGRTRVDRVATVNARIGWKALTAAEYQPDGYAFLSTPNIKGRDIDFSNVNYISEFRYEESPELQLKPGDVLLAKDGNTLGIVNIVRDLPRPATVNGSIAVIRSTGIDPSYLRYVLASRVTQATINMLKGGMGVPHLFQWDINRLPIPLPPEEEQRRIADFLDTETARMDRLRSSLAQFDRAVREREQAVLAKMLHPGAEKPGDSLRNGWKWTPLTYLTDQFRRIMYGIVLPGPNVTEGVPIIKGGDVAANRLSLQTLNRTTREIEAGYARSRVKGGDIVIAIRGSVGEIAVVPNELTGANLTQDTARISAAPGVSPDWLRLILESPAVVHQIQQRVTGATIKGINIWDLKRLLVPTPDSAEQTSLAASASRVLGTHEALRSRVARHSALLAERRQALITAAVTGQIDVSTASGRGIEE
ncbi:restriction endonuclease subunit S [Streptomyces sp. NPDC055952]|uniref:restriction endonuclease subunit S n=1 Tax=Streptomyces sp. NPDC055952 TaxID=3345663 RepID=UPI0035DB5D36